MNLDKIVCYGAGSAYHWVEEALESRLGTEVVCVIDRHASSLQSEFHCPVIDPSDHTQLCAVALQYPDVPVVITLGNQTLVDAVALLLGQAGFRHIVTLNAIFEVHLGFQLEDDTVEGLEATRLSHLEEIRHVRSLLADAESISVFDAVMTIYQMRQGSWVSHHPAHALHFPPEFASRMDYDCVIKCGVALDEVELILGQEHHRIKQLIGFEPDTAKFASLAPDPSLWMSQHVPRSPLNSETEVRIIPAAVTSSHTMRAFHSSTLPHPACPKYARRTPQHGGFGSRLREGGSLQVETVTLDYALEGFEPTVIFADAEGEEVNVLMGAINCIREHRPVLVIALYHRLSHMWQVAQFIHSHFEDYELYIRNYTGFIYETFLIAMPKVAAEHT